MRTRATAIAIVLIALSSPWVYAKSDPAYTTVVLEYDGPNSRYISPIIVSSSAEEAERYKQKLFGGPLVDFAEVYIVKESIWKEIAEILSAKDDLRQSGAANGQIRAPQLRIVLATGHDFQETTVGAEEGAQILDEIKERASEYPLLVGALSEIEQPMSYYLKHPK